MTDRNYSFRLSDALDEQGRNVFRLHVEPRHVRTTIDELRAQADDLERRADARDMDEDAAFQTTRQVLERARLLPIPSSRPWRSDETLNGVYKNYSS